MKLIAGQQAPDFSLTDIHGHKVNLLDYERKKLLICFFRYAGCPFCNLMFLGLKEQYERFSKMGLNVIVFFQSPADSILKYACKTEPPFHVIADPDRIIYEKYGVESSKAGLFKGMLDVPTYYQVFIRHKQKQHKIDGDMLLMPAFFLIEPPGLSIYSAYYGETFVDQIPFVKIEEFLLFSQQ